MDLTPYIDNLRRELAVAAEAGGEDARALAERLIAPLESATRLALLDALSAAADEITRDLAPGSVDLRLRGRNPDFIVTSPPADPSFDDDAEHCSPTARDGVAAAPAVPDADEGSTARITLRLAEQLKLRIEEAAGLGGLSVNAWLVRAIVAALEPDDREHHPGRRGPRIGGRYTGWVR